jgi:hypothetical protein
MMRCGQKYHVGTSKQKKQLPRVIERRDIDEIPQQHATLIQEGRDYILGLGSWKNELLHCLSHEDAAAHNASCDPTV